MRTVSATVRRRFPYSLTGATTEYQGRAVITLDSAVEFYKVFHPNCRHSLSAVVES
jgi:hypothetical protein